MSDPPEEFGRYIVHELLGEGGMATVHRAETLGVAGFRKTVALKRLLPHMANPEVVRAFVDEARLASHLNHPNIAQTYDFGKVGENYYIAMELVPGPTLSKLRRHCAETAIQFPVPIALHILIQICDALDYAHNLTDDNRVPLGIIHRDVSPTNIIVSTTSTIKLIDFGIAKAANITSRTLTGVVKGKFAYIAPEYLEGKIDSRSDLFAVGVIAHELLTMRALFRADDDGETLKRVRGMKIQPRSKLNRDVSQDLDDIVMTALARDPAERWQHANAMRVALGNAAHEAGDLPTSQQFKRWVDNALAVVPPPQRAAIRRSLAELADPAPVSEPRGPHDPTIQAHVRLAAPERRPSRRMRTIAIGKAMIAAATEQRRTKKVLLVLLAIAAILGGVYAAHYYDVIDIPWLNVE